MFLYSHTHRSIGSKHLSAPGPPPYITLGPFGFFSFFSLKRLFVFLTSSWYSPQVFWAGVWDSPQYLNDEKYANIEGGLSYFVSYSTWFKLVVSMRNRNKNIFITQKAAKGWGGGSYLHVPMFASVILCNKRQPI